MNDQPTESTPPSEEAELQSRRLFLQGMGKWSGAAIIAAVAGASLSISPEASAGGWINRRGGGGGGWINGHGGGGGWINRSGGGGWINGHGGGGGSWINRRY